jgi:solute:Na+ symporter, SSS family
MVTFGIVVAYLLGTYLLGYYLKRKSGTQDKTVHKLFVADGNLALFTVSALLFGDMIGASSETGTAGTGYSMGLAGGWGVWGSSFGCILFSVCFSAFFFRIRKTGITTGPEAYGLRFDKPIRYLVLIFTLIPLFILFSAQITAAVLYLSSMIEIDNTVATAIVFFLFLAMGMLGITGVAQMNKVHSFVIIFGLAFAAIACLYYVGGPEKLVEQLPSSYFNPFVAGPLTVSAQFLGSALGFSISVTSISIAYCAKSMKVAKQSHWIVAIVSSIFALFPLIIGLCGAATLEGIRPDSVLFAMTNHISPVLSGVVLMAVFAAIFSTAPWFLLAMANLIVQDMYTPYVQARGKEISQKKAVAIARGVMCLVLVGAVFMSGQNTSLLDTLMGASQIKAIAAILLMVGIYWKRLTNIAGFLGLLMGGTISTVWYFMGYPFGIQPLWPGLIIAVITFVVGSFLTSKEKVSKDYDRYEARLAEYPEDPLPACPTDDSANI